jgi:hypothetical protein
LAYHPIYPGLWKEWREWIDEVVLAILLNPYLN